MDSPTRRPAAKQQTFDKWFQDTPSEVRAPDETDAQQTFDKWFQDTPSEVRAPDETDALLATALLVPRGS